MAKARSEYTIGDMIRLNGGFYKTKFFKQAYSTDAYAKLIDSFRFIKVYTRDYPHLRALNYANTLCIKRDGIGDPLSPLVERIQIQATLGMLIVQSQEAFTEVKEKQTQLLEQIQGEINHTYTSNIENRYANELADCEETIESHSRSIERYGREIAAYQARFKQETDRMETLEDMIYRATEDGQARKDPMIDQIHAIINDGAWMYVGMNEDGHHQFISSEDIVCSEVNQSAGINRSVNFGRFRVCLNPNTFNMSVYPFKDNLTNVQSDGPFHPHISSNGTICWGSIASAIDVQIRNGMWSTVMVSLAELLAVYSPNNPYRTLLHFDRLQKNTIKYSAAKRQVTFEQIMDTLDYRKPIQIPVYIMELLDLAPTTQEVDERTFDEEVEEYEGTLRGIFIPNFSDETTGTQEVSL